MIRPYLWMGLAAVMLLAPFQPAVGAQSPAAIERWEAALSPLAERLLRSQGSLSAEGTDHIFGVPQVDAKRVFMPVSPWQPLPDGFVPPDLVRLGGVPRVLGQPVSAALMPDLEQMVAESQRDGVDLVVLSAYRSFADQEAIFERNVQRAIYRPGGMLSRADAERAVERFSARAGHSQHQLGTAIDFTSAEMNYGLGARFAETRTGQWLREQSWKFGFVFPYTDAAEARSGYRNEPWHVRWVGRQLAQIMQTDGYLEASYPIADDYILAVSELSSRWYTSGHPGESRE